MALCSLSRRGPADSLTLRCVEYDLCKGEEGGGSGCSGARRLVVAGSTVLVSWVGRFGREMGEMMRQRMRGREGRRARHIVEENAVFERFQSRNRNFGAKDLVGHEGTDRGGRWQRPKCDCVATSESG
jgi:hypothetical protein